MKSIVFAYIVCGKKEEALSIGKALVSEKLCACVNIIPGMQSIYNWKNEIVEDNECILIAKTSADLFDELKERVVQLHSYEVPCVLMLNVEKGNKEYVDWLFKNLR